ncbi:hypothetical protein CYB_1770 [Synechococcus sp. JA-2-3B'a(2-13)]|nr:hypothetical protein CYB_1770 [Synechococcus sp. JA-2-3B'a(2-13)]
MDLDRADIGSLNTLQADLSLFFSLAKNLNTPCPKGRKFLITGIS